jgi:hypothetical protein
MHPAVAALSLDEKGFVLGAALARTPAADVAARLTGGAGARCAAALAALAEGSRAARAAEIAALAALVRAPVPAGIERIHPDWLRERFQRESSAVVRAVAAGLPEEVRRIAADLLRARGDAASREPGAGAAAVAALQRIVFAGLVPLAGAGAPATPIARELSAVDFADVARAAVARGARVLAQALAAEGEAALQAVAQRLPRALGLALLAAANERG